jgi:sRNA-binding protein
MSKNERAPAVDQPGPQLTHGHKTNSPCDHTNPASLIALLEERWPQCFALYQARRKPLKIGIHLDVIAALAGEVEESAIRKALAVYTNNVWYLKTLKVDAVRIDLDGVRAGVVTKEAERWAWLEIGRKKVKKESESDLRVKFSRPVSERPEPTPDAEDPDGKWATNPHPANADKPQLKLFKKGGAR